MDGDRYAALVARDPRFDGVFFVGVSTTGIYCRPICPARTPARARCAFFASAALAERAGFRACLRCRPELAPGTRGAVADVDAVDHLVRAAAARIAEGALNGDGDVDALAAELGVSARHLRRATEARLGVSPIELAQSARLALAKQLLQDSTLSITEIAFAAGYGSVRRFNAAFAAAMRVAPQAVRRAAHAPVEAGGLVLRLDYRPPLAWRELLAFLAARAIPGVEEVDAHGYRRVVAIDAAVGTIAVAPEPDRPALRLAISPGLVRAVMPLVARVRRLFDLDAHPAAIAGVLGADPILAAAVAARPGLRVPGAIDPFEAAIRALLGQQVSVAAATTLAGRFAARFGTPLEPAARAGTLVTRFPTARAIADAPVDAIAAIGLPGTRAAAIRGVATAIADRALALDGADLAAFVAAATALPGLGPWTAHYLAMRALHHPDAFPAADLGVRKALAPHGVATPRAAEAYSARWRPFRSYAVLHLWTGTPAPGDQDDDRDPARAPAPPRDRLAARRAAPARARGRADRRVPAGAGGAGVDAGARPARRARGRRRAARRVLRG